MSTITVSNINDGTTSVPSTYVTNGSAKAWVNFNGSGTVAIRESLNVSSLSDNDTGQYTLGFSSSFASASYSPSAMNGGNNGGSANYPQEAYTATASSIRGLYLLSNANVHDPANAFFQSFGDLA